MEARAYSKVVVANAYALPPTRDLSVRRMSCVHRIRAKTEATVPAPVLIPSPAPVKMASLVALAVS